MKKFKKALSILLLLVFSTFTFVGCGKQSKSLVYEKKDFTESVETILNPDCGFYRPIGFSLTENGGNKSSIGVNGDVSLQHLRINLGQFSREVNGQEDKVLSQQALDYLDGVLDTLYKNNKNAIVRFAYDNFDGVEDKEPSEEMILTHQSQVCNVLNKYQNTITAIEVGFVGKWGEMHTSKLANYDTIDKLIDGYLTQTDNFPILTRTPRMIYHYLGFTVNVLEDENNIILPSSNAYRLGIYNDGYLGSGNDLGTYADREKEIKWLQNQTNHLPFGGEIMNNSMAYIENCLPYMREVNLSYLNYEWNYNMTQTNWGSNFYTSEIGDEKNYFGQTAQVYVRNHMGYRLVLNSSKIYKQNSNKYEFEINLNNIGFGNVNRAKQMSLVVVNENGENSEIKLDKLYKGENQILIKQKLNLQSGNNKIYLKLYNGFYQDSSRYEIAFSSTGVFDKNLKANYVGEINI